MPGTVDPTLVSDLMRSTGRARIRATGTSMVPSIWPGDELLIQSISCPLSPGQVVAWQAEQRIFIHRIVNLSDDQKTILTCGDRLSVVDAPFSQEQLLGVVTHVFRKGVAIAVSRDVSRAARLLRLTSRLSDWPTFLLVRVRELADLSREH